MAKGQKKLPVWSSTKPVTLGATIPAKLPTKFCSPVHRPAACGPASACVIAQTFDELMPRKEVVRITAAVENPGPVRTAANAKIAAPAIPPLVNVLRTRVGEAPRAIHQSDRRPQIAAVTAQERYDPPAMTAMRSIEKWRPRTK